MIGYVIMRLALVTQWLRAIRDDPVHRATLQRYAIGVALCQLGWLALLLRPDFWALAWLVLVPVELLLPLWAQRGATLSFNNDHLTERYGLFMIIVLGESVLAASIAIQSVIGAGLSLDLLTVIVGGLLVVYAMWWIYFDRPEEHLLESLAAAQIWNYLHLVIFASVAAVGAGLVVAIEQATGQASLGWQWTGLVVGVPLVIYLVAMWLLYVRTPAGRPHARIVPVASVLILVGSFAPAPIPVIGIVLAATIAFKLALRMRAHRAAHLAEHWGMPLD